MSVRFAWGQAEVLHPFYQVIGIDLAHLRIAQNDTVFVSKNAVDYTQKRQK